MLTQRIFNLISRLIFSRWTHGYREYHGACEDSCTARFGPLQLERNHCFVLDHADAAIGIQLPTLHYRNGRFQSGCLSLRYRVCQGTEPVRSSGLDITWLRPLAKGAARPSADNHFPL